MPILKAASVVHEKSGSLQCAPYPKAFSAMGSNEMKSKRPVSAPLRADHPPPKRKSKTGLPGDKHKESARSTITSAVSSHENESVEIPDFHAIPVVEDRKRSMGEELRQRLKSEKGESRSVISGKSGRSGKTSQSKLMQLQEMEAKLEEWMDGEVEDLLYEIEGLRYALADKSMKLEMESVNRKRSQQQLKQMEAAMSELEEDRKLLATTLSQSEKKISLLEKNSKALAKFEVSAKGDLKSMRRRIEQLEKEQDSLKDECGKLRGNAKRADIAAEKSKKNAEEAMHESAKSKSHAEQWHTSYEQLSAEYGTATSTWTAKEEQFIRTIGEQEAELQRLSPIEAALLQLQDEHALLIRRAEEAEALLKEDDGKMVHYAVLERRVNELVEDNRKLKKSEAVYEQELKGLRQVAHRRQAQILTQQRGAMEKEKKIDYLTKVCSMRDGENRKLSSQMHALQTHLAAEKKYSDRLEANAQVGPEVGPLQIAILSLEKSKLSGYVDLSPCQGGFVKFFPSQKQK